ncbi:4-nitrophenyl phosphatase [Ceratocystis lukuohia]|uniref:4-nitrophenylphosphatase n=1 Tax=Ceratocystis lukuohia TaxID=2019550 RepID=A0ABR4MB84_9PEZI
MSQPQFISGNPAAIDKFLEGFDVSYTLCFSGVLWSGDSVYENIPETLNMLKAKGKKIVFVTNNSTKSRNDYQKKLTKMGIQCELDEVFCSSYSASIYISRILQLPEGKHKVFAIGESGMKEELESEGLVVVGGPADTYNRNIEPEDYQAMADKTALDPEVGVVLVGLDRKINYLKLSMAFHYIRNGAKFLATNIDSTLPSHHTFFPGAGACSIPLVHMTGETPLALGKPGQAMMDAIEGKFQLDRARTCMVGDRLNTDIKFGIDGKLGGTLMVLTGVNQKADFEAKDAVAVPAFYANKLSDLLAASK